MACGTFTVDKVPENELQETMDIWLASTPTPKVTSIKNPDGTYTVTAVYPNPCPSSTTHDPGTSATPGTSGKNRGSKTPGTKKS
jgi:hypothetical protein